MPRLPYSFEACPIDLFQRLAAYPVHAVDGNSSVLYISAFTFLVNKLR